MRTAVPFGKQHRFDLSELQNFRLTKVHGWIKARLPAWDTTKKDATAVAHFVACGCLGLTVRFMPFGRNLFDEGTTVAYWRVHFPAGISLLCLTFLYGQPAARAQDYPRWEAFGGFAYANVGLGPQSSSFAPKGKNYYGVHLSLNFNPTRNLSLQLLDIGIQSGGTKLRPLFTKSDITVNTSQALFGPQLTVRRPKANVFGRALIGVTNTRLVRSNSFNSFDLVSKTNLALGFGGGVDLNLTPRLAVRLVQADYIHTRLNGVWQSDYRVSVGIVFRFKYTENWRSR